MISSQGRSELGWCSGVNRCYGYGAGAAALQVRAVEADLRKGSKHVVFFVLLIRYYYLLDNTRSYIPLLCLTEPHCLFH
jgi:hypothetical protein